MSRRARRSARWEERAVGQLLSPALGHLPEKHDLDVDNRNRRLNFYPWLVTAYQAQHPKGLLAVARPHHIALTGEKVVLDGSNSLVWGGNKIVQWRWILPDGQDRAGQGGDGVSIGPGPTWPSFG